MKNKKLITWCLIIPLISISLLSGCNQTKEKRSITPYFDGTLMLNDKPVKHAKIMLSTAPDDKLCEKAKTFSSSNQQGQFSLKALTEQYTYTPFVNYQLDEWSICALYNESLYPLHNNNRYGPDSVTGSIFLECDLALPAGSICQIRR